MAGAMLVVEALPVITGFRPHSSARKSRFSPDISANLNALRKLIIEPAVTLFKNIKYVNQPRLSSFYKDKPFST
jgi:hypothetical protein